MKTPKELKAQALDESGCCGGCELYNTTVDNPFGCQEAQAKTALVAELVAYTEKLESENADLKSRLIQAERERDALMYDYPIGIECHTCKHETTDCYEFPCNDCVEASRNAQHLMWEWRGVCEENTGRDEHGG